MDINMLFFEIFGAEEMGKVGGKPSNKQTNLTQMILKPRGNILTSS